MQVVDTSHLLEGLDDLVELHIRHVVPSAECHIAFSASGVLVYSRLIDLLSAEAFLAKGMVAGEENGVFIDFHANGALQHLAEILVEVIRNDYALAFFFFNMGPFLQYAAK